ncbi:hypothetical protein [Rhizobium ruizarguesonis]|uniref:hypothetical protein n=1 Tax=Rhizobium ruizarguesonis TaxID=2081791 RepID=UPI0013E00B9C|nr:hypothetical protein [Rhizobium ruizarguesonis]NEI79061.1 hypothetical protein [Rhizobium ruizarguesonis]
MSEMQALEKRRKVVTDQIVRLREELASLEAELMELDVAGSVLARVAGAKYDRKDAGRDYVSGSYSIQTKIRALHHNRFDTCCLACDDRVKHFAVYPPPPAGFYGGSAGWDILAKKQLSLPEKITVAMRYAHSQAIDALAPKEIENYILVLFGDVPEKQNVNSVAWRMAKSGTLCKADDAPKYWLPANEKTADTAPAKGQSAAFVSTRAKGRQAVPGGGT